MCVEKKAKRAADIYFDNDFPKLYEKIEGGRTIKFSFKCEYGSIRHNFLSRPIPELINGIQYFDAITAYGYGGPIIESLIDEGEKPKLLGAFEKAFSVYCEKNNIVSEFVRFHPIFGNGKDFAEVYNTEHDRNTVATNLKDYPDFLNEEYSKGCRKNIRQALNKGVTVEIIEKPESLDEFKEIYYSTMDRNNASEYYYFQEGYFEKCLNLYRDSILLVKALYEGKVIAAGFYFVWDKMVHIHLSGTLSEYLFLSPAYILRYGVTDWAQKNGYELIHHGGGRSNSEEDSLFKFKKQFGKNTEYPFYIGKKIWNKPVYDELCRITNTGETGFFPAYRKR